jgi:hypothetical protein
VSSVAGSAGLTKRSGADAAMRRLLRVPETTPGVRAEEAAHRLFSASMVLSGTRCLLGYVILPILAPALGAAAGFAPIIGIPLGIVALIFDVRGMRRFFVADHRWRWPIAGIYLTVMVLVLILLARDIAHIA